MVQPVYATVDDLTTWLGSYPPANAVSLLARASLVVDELLTAAVYPVDVDGAPTDVTAQAAMRDAVCAQVEWWMAAPVDGCGDGKARLRPANRQAGDPKMPRPDIAPDAIRTLHRAGLLPVHARLIG